MRVAEYKQTGTRQEGKTILIPAELDEEGNVLTEEHEETVTVDIPVMGMVYRDMTPEEEAQAIAEQENVPEIEPTPEERLNQLEQALTALIGGDTGE